MIVFNSGPQCHGGSQTDLGGLPHLPGEPKGVHVAVRADSGKPVEVPRAP